MNDVENLLRENGIRYESSGNNLVTLCLNPSHNDHHPSLRINKENGLFHCFACGFKGNYFTLEKLLTGKSSFKKENLKEIKSVKIKTLYKPIKIIGKLKDVHSSNEVMKFLSSIGCSEKFIKKFNVKYSSYSEMIADELYDNEEVSATKMYNRIVIPIEDEKKRIINYECRTFIGEEPKVKYVKGGSMDTIFNWNNIDKSKTVVSVESVKNLMRIYNVYPNVIALFHAIPTKKQMDMLNQIPNLIHFGDNDCGFFGDDKLKRKGTLQVLGENYKGNLKLTWDNRTYVKNGKIKGYDANDCTEKEIINHIENAVSYEDYIKSKKDKIFW